MRPDFLEEARRTGKFTPLTYRAGDVSNGRRTTSAPTFAQIEDNPLNTRQRPHRHWPFSARCQVLRLLHRRLHPPGGRRA
ncbi:hypothetical protein HBB16_13670 [Pseudonocardia sp. MCCB 268]|nr:hypothetical protein [Pseudonocardia cytotoxica]